MNPDDTEVTEETMTGEIAGERAIGQDTPSPRVVMDEASEVSPDIFANVTTASVSSGRVRVSTSGSDYAMAVDPSVEGWIATEPEIDRDAVRSRQADLVDPLILGTSMTIVGAGAIGSFVALTLAKMGFHNLEVVDDDQVSTENISNQFYRYNDIGSLKVDALKQMIMDFEGINVNNVSRRFRRNMRDWRYSEVMVSAVDSMQARKDIWNSVKRNTDVSYFIDGRMGGQQAEVYTVDLLDQNQKRAYEKYLWSEDEASELPCTQKAVMYNVLWIASQMANNLRLMLEEKAFPPVIHMDFENVNHMNITQPEV